MRIAAFAPLHATGGGLPANRRCRGMPLLLLVPDGGRPVWECVMGAHADDGERVGERLFRVGAPLSGGRSEARRRAQP